MVRGSAGGIYTSPSTSFRMIVAGPHLLLAMSALPKARQLDAGWGDAYGDDRMARLDRLARRFRVGAISLEFRV